MKNTVEVFVTKNRKFRAKIKEADLDYPYEVTVGGKEWQAGKGRTHKEEIKKQCEHILCGLDLYYGKYLK
jgi:hypothetical protein